MRAMKNRSAGERRTQSGKRLAVRPPESTRDEALAVVSHDLRNLITAIRLKAGLLERDLPDDGTRPRKLAHEIGSACDMLERWAEDLFDLSEVDDGGGLTISIAEHDPREIVSRAVEMLLAKAAAKGLELCADTAAKVPRIQCDRDRILQVLTNLMGNAVKFTKRGSIIARVRLDDEGCVCFSVSDSGPGIPAEAQEKIFERGYRSERKSGGGAGLGLYISRHMVQSHGGRIWVESEAGKGSVFKFTLPVG
jgi:signal transduction histidine kinase